MDFQKVINNGHMVKTKIYQEQNNYIQTLRLLLGHGANVVEAFFFTGNGNVFPSTILKQSFSAVLSKKKYS